MNHLNLQNTTSYATAPPPVEVQTSDGLGASLARLAGRAPEVSELLVCDSQPVTAAGVRALLADTPSICVLPNCETLSAARTSVRQHTPRIVMLDKALGMQAVLEWITDLRLTLSREGSRAVPAIVVWGVSMTEAEALRFLQAGARGIVRKTATGETLVACLEAVAQGRSWMEDSVFRNTPTPERYHRSELTPREQQVMELVEQGQKNREIARELGIRPAPSRFISNTSLRRRVCAAATAWPSPGCAKRAFSPSTPPPTNNRPLEMAMLF